MIPPHRTTPALILSVVCLATTTLGLFTSSAQSIPLEADAARKIGNKIWQNECAGSVSGLTSWNSGEDFASLGIGHFIWYPKGKNGPFHESFPDLIAFLRKQDAAIPSWLTPGLPCPWNSRAEFQAAQSSPKMEQLRSLLKSTVALQTAFIVDRLEAALPKMSQAAPSGERETIRKRFYGVASSAAGIYALIDYVNFKGEGVSPSERYKGQGWGLLQVLEGMQGNDVKAFAASAKRVLTGRVENSPPARNEAKWLPGWKNRIDTYTAF